MSDVRTRLGALSAAQRAWLARQLAHSRPPRVALQRSPRGAGVNTFRTSSAQERLWFLEQVAPGTAAYNVAAAFRAVGRLDLDLLRRSLATVVARHESLRTTFAVIDGAPVQVVSPIAVPGFVAHDLRGIEGEAARAAAARRAIADEAERPFDVARGPLLRLTVFRVADDEHLVCAVLHHLIADAWSIDIVIRDLTAAYRAGAESRTSDLAVPEIQYPDYAEWQRAVLSGERRQMLETHWCRQLRGAAYPVVPTTKGLSFRGASRALEIAPALAEAVRAFACRAGTTVFVTILAVWQMVLRRWLPQDDVTVLSPVANRDRSETAEVVGFFVNVVALRVRMIGDPCFSALVADVRRVVHDALQQQELPFEMLLGALGIDRTLDRPPLSPIAFAVERAVAETIDLPGVEVFPWPLETKAVRTDLALIVREHANGLTGCLEYRRDHYQAETIDRLLADVVASLARAIADPSRPLSELTVRTDASASTAHAAGGESVWARFVAQATRTPDAVAVRAGDATIDYRALGARAVAVGEDLRRCGVEPGAIVAVWGERGIAFVSAVLGILRIRAVHLPIDPRWPLARVVQVLAQSGSRVLLAGAGLPASVREAVSTMVVPIAEAALATSIADDAGADQRPSDDVAYVVYTSGSTGVPKGALVTHGGLQNHLEAKRELLELSAADRVAQTAAPSFDIMLWQCLAGLLVGAEIVVVDEASARDPMRLRSAVAACGVTVLEVVPAVLQVLLEADVADGTRAFGGLRWLVVTGEALPPSLCREWLRRYPAIPLVNAYGPTECADDVTHHLVRTPPAATNDRIPIGTPIPNVQIHVRDAVLRPVAVGEVGELCVTGVAVGRGYLGDPERTSATFVERDPVTGQRLYRTGDRGRVLPDGSFECLGRCDDQVKIRGVRIEPGEVEAVLVRHPDVRQAAVVARSWPDGESRLVAYVVANGAAADLGPLLRRYAAEHLPASMVPSLVVPLDRLPLGPNGKIDRGALPSPASDPDTSAAEPLLPATDVARILAEVWREVLGVEPPSPDADFFALGGDSLASIRVVARARRHGIVLTPHQLFEHPTIAGLAAIARMEVGVAAEQGVVVGDVDLTPIQRLWLEADLPDPHHYNLAMLLAVEQPPAPDHLAVAVEHVMRHHDMLRLRLRRDSEGWRQTIAGLDGEVPFTHVDLSTLPDGAVPATIERLAAAQQATLSLTAGPVWRVVLFDLGPGRPSRLLVVVHHLACDVVSWPILLEDLATICEQVRIGAAIALPAKTSPFPSWSRRLAAWAQMPERRSERTFWAQACATSGARLPGRLASGPATIAAMERVWTDCTTAETLAVQRAAAEHAVSIEVVLLVGLAMAVTEMAGGDALLLYLERHGREPLFPELDVSRTVGWFTAVFPVRLTVAANGRTDETLALVDRHLRAIPAGGIGYGALGAAHDVTVRTLPRPEISFNYLGRLDLPNGARWRRAVESPGSEVGGRGTRPTLLDVTAHLVDGRLQIAWDYDAPRYPRAMIERLAERCRTIACDFATATERATDARPGDQTRTS